METREENHNIMIMKQEKRIDEMEERRWKITFLGKRRN